MAIKNVTFKRKFAEMTPRDKANQSLAFAKKISDYSHTIISGTHIKRNRGNGSSNQAVPAV